MALGAWVGDQFRQRNRKRRRIVEVNIKLCFPELGDLERERLCVKHFQAYGCSLVDMGLSLWGSERRLRKLVSIEGLEDYQQLRTDKKVMLVTWHLTTLEICANMVGLAGPTVSMMKSMKNPVLTWQFARARSRFNDIDLVLRNEGLKPLIQGLGEGKQCFLIPDEDIVGSQGKIMFVPFFGVARAMLLTPARLAKLAGAVVVTCAARLIPETGRYVCTFMPPIEPVDSADVESVSRAITESMEHLIRQAPEQYLWTFRWFQTRPDGAKSPYDVIQP